MILKTSFQIKLKGNVNFQLTLSSLVKCKLKFSFNFIYNDSVGSDANNDCHADFYNRGRIRDLCEVPEFYEDS